MGDIKEVLNRSSVFGSLGKEDTERLKPLFDPRKIHPGDILATAGEAADYFFLLATGTILLAMDGGRSVVLNTCGDFIGLELLSARGIYTSRLTALEKGCVFAIPRQAFLDIIQEDSSGASAIMTAWHEYLEVTAPFTKNIEDPGLWEHF
jgi:CRP-like cAMP-binding protein